MTEHEQAIEAERRNRETEEMLKRIAELEREEEEYIDAIDRLKLDLTQKKTEAEALQQCLYHLEQEAQEADKQIETLVVEKTALEAKLAAAREAWKDFPVNVNWDSNEMEAEWSDACESMNTALATDAPAPLTGTKYCPTCGFIAEVNKSCHNEFHNKALATDTPAEAPLTGEQWREAIARELEQFYDEHYAPVIREFTEARARELLGHEEKKD